MSDAAYHREYLNRGDNRERHNARCRVAYARDQAGKAATHKKRYGETLEETAARFAAQGYICASCGTPDPGNKNGQWATDHCHMNKIVRGVLCGPCNWAIGHAKDNPIRLRAMADYLERIMEPIQIDDLFIKYGTDKGGPWGWGYSPVYQEHLGPRRASVKRVLEIGICGHRDIPGNVVGASLFAWRDFFPYAHVYGLDNDGKFIFNDKPRITTVLADAYDHVQLQSALRFFDVPVGGFDFICDDAVHDPMPQMALLRSLWPYLAVGGIYAMEDVCNYKVADNDLFEAMVKPLMVEHDNMRCTEYQTHKAERLLIFHKDPYPQ